MNNNDVNDQDRSGVELCLRDLSEAGYTGEDLSKIGPIVALLGTNAITYWRRLFISTKAHKIPIETLLQKIKQAWEAAFQYGTPGRLGDPDDVAPPDVGMRNACALIKLYADLGLPPPKML